MSQALYRKWRPRSWDEVVGQEHVIQTLRNAIIGERVAHAYLFAGPRGTGKTTTARLLAKAVNCLSEDRAARPCNQCDHCLAVNEGRFMDLIEIDAASNTSVEDVRDLRDKINYAPTQGKYKVYIIDEVHMLSTAAFNALLKTLEEPPAHAIFILATTEVHKIPATVLSRCQRHEFRRIGVMEITRHLQEMATQEGLEVEPEALTLIARQSTGAMRDAISLLDQLASTGDKITLEKAQNVLGTATNRLVIDLVEALLARNAANGLEQIHAALDSGADSRQFARQVVEYLRSLLMIRMGNNDALEAPVDQRQQMSDQAQRFTNPWLLESLRSFNDAATDLRGGWHPGLLLELAFAESLEETAPAAAVVHPQKAAEPVQKAAPLPQPTGQSGPEIKPARPAEENVLYQRAEMVEQSGETALEPEGSAEPAAEAAAGLTFAALLQQWPRIRALVKKHSPQTEGLINSSKLMGIKDGALILSLSPVLKQKMESGPHQEITARAIAHVTGVNLEVHCVLQTAKSEGGLAQDVEVEDDGIVGTAMRDLGGKLVDIQ